MAKTLVHESRNGAIWGKEGDRETGMEGAVAMDMVCSDENVIVKSFTSWLCPNFKTLRKLRKGSKGGNRHLKPCDIVFEITEWTSRVTVSSRAWWVGLSKHLDVMTVADCASGEAEPVTQHVPRRWSPDGRTWGQPKPHETLSQKLKSKTKAHLKKKKKPWMMSPNVKDIIK